jgi:transcription initiation factor TFIIE subunit alpha
MSIDKDEATRRAEREKEAEAKRLVYLYRAACLVDVLLRQQNIMPSWHTKSTISGDLTALGVAAASHAASIQRSPISASSGSNAAILESLANPGARPIPKAGASSNASILSGLGRAPNGPTSTETGVKVEKQEKPVINKQSDCSHFSIERQRLNFDIISAF